MIVWLFKKLFYLYVCVYLLTIYFYRIRSIITVREVHSKPYQYQFLDHLLEEGVNVMVAVQYQELLLLKKMSLTRIFMWWMKRRVSLLARLPAPFASLAVG